MVELLVGDISAEPFNAFAVIGLLLTMLVLLAHGRRPVRVAALSGGTLALLATSSLLRF